MASNRVLSLRQFSPLSSRAFDPSLPGQWYLGYACHTCHEAIPVLACDERTSISLGGSGTMTVRCPHCSARHPYCVQELRKVQTPVAH